MLEWAKDAPEGINAKNPNRMKWKEHIETAFFLMKEKGYAPAEARLLIEEKEGLTRKQAETFRVVLNKKIREREALRKKAKEARQDQGQQ